MTGGTGGLGLAVSEAMVDAGYRTVVTWVVDGEAERARSVLGDRIELRRLDVTDPADAGALAAELDTGCCGAGRSCTWSAGTSVIGHLAR